MLRQALGRVASLGAALAMIITLVPLSSVAAQSRYFGDPAFQRIWERNDRPVETLVTTRSWTWGPNSFFAGSEPFKQGVNGRRQVQYFDKARMEVDDELKAKDDPNYVTNGLLVRELVAGEVAIGKAQGDVETRSPSTEAVAGDPAKDNQNAPTYASFRDIASLKADRPAENRIGERVTKRILKSGEVRELSSEQQALSELVKLTIFEPNLKHNIPDKFYEFLIQTGAIYESGRINPTGSVFQPWEFVMGLPITEPLWTTTKVGGVERWVLVQLFERRVLTYTPTNLPGFQVEMGNVGQHYYRWRYEGGSGGSQDGAPRIDSGPTRTELTATSAKIEWTTNEETTSRIEYGLEREKLEWTAGSFERKTSHVVNIGSLKPDTVYYWRIISRDKDDNIVSNASIHSFKTKAS
jgi:hypothetical protein